MSIDYDKYENATTLERCKAIDTLLYSAGLALSFGKPQEERLSDSITRTHYTPVISGCASHRKDCEKFEYFCPVRVKPNGKLKTSETVVEDKEYVPQRIDHESHYRTIANWRVDRAVGFISCLMLDITYLESEGIDDVADYIAHVGANNATAIREAMKTHTALIETKKKVQSLFSYSEIEQLQSIVYGY